MATTTLAKRAQNSSTNFEELWSAAVQNYETNTGVKFSDVAKIKSVNALWQTIESNNQKYEALRKENGKFYKYFKLVANGLYKIADVVVQNVSAVAPVLPSPQKLLGVFAILLDAAQAVSALLEQISDLFKKLDEYLKRLKTYLTVKLTDGVKGHLGQALILILDIFAVSTKIVGKSSRGLRMKVFGKTLLNKIGFDLFDPSYGVNDLVDALDALTSEEIPVVLADTYATGQETNEVVIGMESSLGGVMESTNRLEEQSELVYNSIKYRPDDELTEEQQLLCRLEPQKIYDIRFNQLEEDSKPDVSDWIGEDLHVQEWLNGECTLLWVSGPAKSGKTFLSVQVIQRCLALTDRHCAFVHLQITNSGKPLLSRALQTMAYQLAQTCVPYSKYIREQCKDASSTWTVTKSWQRLFLDFFTRCKSQSDVRFYLIFDGLDEITQTDCKKLGDSVSKLVGSGKKNIQIMLFSRPELENDLYKDVKTVATLRVDQSNTAGLESYILGVRLPETAVARFSMSFRQKLAKKLVAKADGIFVWVDDAVKQLEAEPSEDQVLKAVAKAPRGMAGMITTTLERLAQQLSNDDIQDLRSMLIWLTFAKQNSSAYTLDGVAQMMRSTNGSVQWLRYKLTTQYGILFGIEEAKALQKPDNPSAKDEDEEMDMKRITVSLKSAYLYNFLVASTKRMAPSQDDSVSIIASAAFAKHKVAHICVRTVAYPKFRDQWQKYDDFQRYALAHWSKHLRETKAGFGNSAQKKDILLAIRALLTRDAALSYWCRRKERKELSLQNARAIRAFFIAPAAAEILGEGTTVIQKKWYKKIHAHPIHVFDPVLEHLARTWLLDPDEPEDDVLRHARTVLGFASWTSKMEKSDNPEEFKATLSTSTSLTVHSQAEIEEVAERYVKQAKRTSLWQLRLALVLRTAKYNEPALQLCKNVARDDETCWKAFLGAGKSALPLGDANRGAALGAKALVALEELYDNDSEDARLPAEKCHLHVARCFRSLAETSPDEVLQYTVKAARSYTHAMLINPENLETFGSYLNLVHDHVVQEMAANSGPQAGLYLTRNQQSPGNGVTEPDDEHAEDTVESSDGEQETHIAKEGEAEDGTVEPGLTHSESLSGHDPTEVEQLTSLYSGLDVESRIRDSKTKGKQSVADLHNRLDGPTPDGISSSKRRRAFESEDGGSDESIDGSNESFEEQDETDSEQDTEGYASSRNGSESGDDSNPDEKSLCDWSPRTLLLHEVLEDDLETILQQEIVELLTKLSSNVITDTYDDMSFSITKDHNHFAKLLVRLYRKSVSQLSKIEHLAFQSNRLHWLAEQYQEAINLAGASHDWADRRGLSRRLGLLYARWLNDDGQALKTWKSDLTKKTIDDGTSLTVREIGRLCVRKLIAHEEVDKYLSQIQRYLDRLEPAAGEGKVDSKAVSYLPVSLAAWYHSKGDSAKAMSLVKPRVMYALTLLSDDDESNDAEALRSLAVAFGSVGDELNQIAALHCIREYDEVRGAVLPTELTGQGGLKGGRGRTKEGLRTGKPNCNGICQREFQQFDGMVVCSICESSFLCRICYAMWQDGAFPLHTCNLQHHQVIVPDLDEKHVFEKGEVLVGDKVMSMTRFKKRIAKKFETVE